MGADDSSPIAAATRSNERGVPYPIGAWLSFWLRSLLVVTTVVLSSSFFFEGQANAPRGSPCVACWPTPSVRLTRPAHSVPVLAAPEPAQALLPSAPTLNSCGTWSHRNPRLPVPE